jgi:hypothetical protein
LTPRALITGPNPPGAAGFEGSRAVSSSLNPSLRPYSALAAKTGDGID